MPQKHHDIEAWTRRLLRDDPPRSKSLIITIFGDSLLPHVGDVRLSELIEVLKPFQVNAQLARTSSFRLAEEGWLQSQREGRNSRYSLTRSGQERVEHAYRRIYDPPAKDWDEAWTIVIPGVEGSSVGRRSELRRELEWEGFGRLGPKLFIHPRADAAAVKELLVRLRLVEDVVVFGARKLDGFSSSAISSLTSHIWDLQRVAQHYRTFLKHFEPAVLLLRARPTPEAAFMLQTLLIHSFRRVVLHDPRLPSALLPSPWPGDAAYDLCRAVYQKTYQQTLAYLTEHLQEGRSGPLMNTESFTARFGGLIV